MVKHEAQELIDLYEKYRLKAESDGDIKTAINCLKEIAKLKGLDKSQTFAKDQVVIALNDLPNVTQTILGFKNGKE